MLHFLRQYRAVALICTALALVFLTRLHLRDLSEIARTYTTFKHLQLNLYTVPRNEEQTWADSRERQLAPKIIHQIFLTDGRNSTLTKYEPAIQSCQRLHPDWEHKLWTDKEAAQFVSELYPQIAPHYQAYRQTIQRTNILRYLLLHHFGGVYLDLDITCRASLGPLLHLPWVTPAAYPAGINNAFILAKPHHDFLTELVHEIPSHDLDWPLPYVENMLTTGCMFISNMWMRYMRRDAQHAAADKLYVLADADGTLEGQMLRGAVTTPLFEHGGASSWHGWDAAAFVMIGKHYILAMVLMLGSGVFVAWLAYRLFFTKRERRRRSFHDEEMLLTKAGKRDLGHLP